MVIEVATQSVLTIIGVTAVVTIALAMLCAYLEWAPIGFLAAIAACVGITMGIYCLVADDAASGAFRWQTPNDLITTMDREDVSSVVIERGERIKTSGGALIDVKRSVHVPLIDLTFRATSNGPVISGTESSGREFYALFDPGQARCDYREYRGRAVEVCREYGKAVRMTRVEKGSHEHGDESDDEFDSDSSDGF
jgi:hypothetical protein